MPCSSHNIPWVSIHATTSWMRSARQVRESRHASDPLQPGVPADPLFLEHQGHQLLRQDVVRLGRRLDRLHVALVPQVDQARGLHQRLVAGGQEKAVADGSGPPPGAAHALEEARHGRGAVDLDHPVQVAHVDAQLQDARGHDHAVVPVGEGVFRLPPLLLAERAVGDEGRDAQLPQPCAQFLRPGTAIHEDQPLLAPVQAGDDHGRVLQRADVVQLDLGLRGCGLRRPEHNALSLCRSRPASR